VRFRDLGAQVALVVLSACASSSQPSEFKCEHELLVKDLVCGFEPVGEHPKVAPISCVAKPSDPDAQPEACTVTTRAFPREHREWASSRVGFGPDWSEVSFENESGLTEVPRGWYQLHAVYTYGNTKRLACGCVSVPFEVTARLVIVSTG
jgi:hypothetical protein